MFTNRITRIIFILSVCFGIAQGVFAENYYVRAGATGANNGSDWANAWNDFDEITGLAPGDNVYIAGGTYKETLRINVSGTSGNRISYFGATDAGEHGTDTGWDSAYDVGSTRADLDSCGVIFESASYIIFDGVVDDGIHIYNPVPNASGVNYKGISTNGQAMDYVTIRYITIEGTGYQVDLGGSATREDGIYWVMRSGQYTTNLLIEYCDIYNVCDGLFLLKVHDSIIQYNEIHHISESHPPPDNPHENVMFLANGDNMIIRYNILHDYSPEGIYLTYDEKNYWIYGNIIYDAYLGIETDVGGLSDNIHVYNNTLVNLYGPIRFRGTNTNSVAYNNLIYGGSMANIMAPSTHDYNWFTGEAPLSELHGVSGGTENPFVNSAALDFRLKEGSSAIDAGIALDAAFATDLTGASRGQGINGKWDIGALESPYSAPIMPFISSLTISPNSGTAKIGSTVTIEVTDENNQGGLTAAGMFNGKSITLSDMGGGTYRGTYTVAEGDNEGMNVEATNITLTSPAGTSVPASSSGSTLTIDSNKPVIQSVTISPNSGTVTTGQNVAINVTAVNTNHTNPTIREVLNLGDDYQGGPANYNFREIIKPDYISSDGSDIRITLSAHSSQNSTVSEVYIGERASSGDIYDMQTGTIQEITFNGGSSGCTVQAGVQKVSDWIIYNYDNSKTYVISFGITDYFRGKRDYTSGSDYFSYISGGAASNAGVANVSSYLGRNNVLLLNKLEIGSPSLEVYTPSNAMINGNSIPLTYQGDGIYSGTYTVLSGDNDGVNVEATGITLTDAAGNVSNSASSSGSTLAVDAEGGGGIPAIELSSAVLDYGDVNATTSSDRTVTVSNTGTATLSISDISSDDPAFTVSPASGSVAAGNDLIVTVTFTPQAVQNYSGTVTITSNAGTENVAVSGSGIAAAGSPEITLDDNSIDFGSKIDGTSTPDTVIVSNTGTAALSISSITSSNASIFAVSPASGTLEPGNDLEVIITFEPVDVQDYSGTVTITSNAGTKNIAVSGSGTAAPSPEITLDDNSINFGSKTIASSTPDTVIVSNTGTATLNIGNISSNESTFDVSPVSGSVEPGNDLEVIITFEPVNVQDYSGTVIITSDAGTENIAVSGSGTAAPSPDIALDKNSIDYGSKINGTSTADLVIVSNTGTFPLTISSIVSSNGSIFTVNPASGSLAPGNDMTVTITFEPAAAESYSGTITITSDAGTEVVSVTGIGTAAAAPAIALNPNSIDYGSKTVTSNTNEIITVSNTGTATLNISNIVSSNGSIFTVSPASGSVESGNDLIVTIMFTPQAVQSYSGTITITSNAGTENIAVSGSGTAAPSPAISLNPSSIDFGNKIVDTNTIELLTVSNTGSATLTIDTISSDDSAFIASPSSGSIEPSNDLIVTVRFSPVAAQSNSGTVTITSNAGTENVAVTGTGYAISKPVIASVTLNPNSGYVKVGESVTITVVAEGNESGLIPSNTTFNGKPISLNDQFDGTYVGIYTVMEGDNDTTNAEATNITLTGPGGASDPASSSGSTLIIDGHSPIIQSIELNPSVAKTAMIGQSIIIVVTAEGAETGLVPSNAFINNTQVSLIDAGDGTYQGSYLIPETDITGANLHAANITLTDLASNVSEPASSAEPVTVIEDTQAPAVSSVAISPDSGTLSDGDEVTISVTVENNETGLSAQAIINNRTIPLLDQGDGTYIGTYIVASTDNSGTNIEVTSVALTDPSGNVSAPSSSTGSTLAIEPSGVPDTEAPDIVSVRITPNSGWVKVGHSVKITVTAENSENGLIPSNAEINGKSIPLVPSGVKDGTYTGTYIVQAGDNQGINVEAINITLTDPAGNVSAAKSSTGSTLNVDVLPPTIESVEVVPSVAKTVGLGQSLSIVVTAGGNETGLIPSDALFNNRYVPLVDLDDGTYRGTYTFQYGDSPGLNIEARNITLTDAAGNVSLTASSTDSDLMLLATSQNPEKSDFNDDNVVNFIDFTLFISAYGKNDSEFGWNEAFDIVKDGVIDFADFDAFIGDYGYSGTAVAKVAKIAVTDPDIPASNITLTLDATTDNSTSIHYVNINFSNVGSFNGFEFSLAYNPNAFEFVPNSINGLVGFIIPSYEEGLITIASMFVDEDFDGTVGIGFREKGDNKILDVELMNASVSENFVVAKIPESTRSSFDFQQTTIAIDNLTVSKSSEQFIVLNWTAPAASDNTSPVTGYLVELAQTPPSSDSWNVTKTVSLTSTPKTPGTQEEVQITGLKSGYSYYISVKPTDANSARSNIVTLNTQVRFFDEDLDTDDPYILRDDDNLFIADNDDSLTFVWSSWQPLGATSYQIKVGAGSLDMIESTSTVQDTVFVVTGQSDTFYVLEVIPVNSSGEELATLRSRSILCTPVTLESPGKPELVSSD